MSSNLLNEISQIRSMMGLKERKIILEASSNVASTPILDLLKSFGKVAVEYAAKSADNIATELGLASRAAGNRVLKAFKQLDDAIKLADTAAAKVAIENIVSLLDNPTLIKISDNILADAADDGARAFITKRVKALSGGGADAAAIRSQVKTDIETLFSEAPAGMKNALKSSADNIVTEVLESIPKVGKTMSVDDVLEILATNPVWSKLRSVKPEAFNELKAEIQVLIDGGAKNADEVAAALEAKAMKKLNPTNLEKYKAWKTRNPRLAKYGPWMIGLGIGSAYAKKYGLFSLLGEYFCEIIFSKYDPDCDAYEKEWEQMRDDAMKEDEVNDENKSNVTCDKKLSDFEEYLTSTGLDSTGATWDESACKGSVSGIDFVYEDGQFK